MHEAERIGGKIEIAADSKTFTIQDEEGIKHKFDDPAG